tara:strand:+ start:1113 stop:1532 length:420 start_codon:yes stop_codon:yes gene_type:complete
MSISFKKITGTNSQILILFSLLDKRKYNISHENMPSLENHRNFVINNPYRAWYLVKKSNINIGSFYIKFDNSIGINLKEYSLDIITEIINFIKENYTPQAPSPSLIPPYFYINSSTENLELKAIFSELNIQSIQVSYKI